MSLALLKFSWVLLEIISCALDDAGGIYGCTDGVNATAAAGGIYVTVAVAAGGICCCCWRYMLLLLEVYVAVAVAVDIGLNG